MTFQDLGKLGFGAVTFTIFSTLSTQGFHFHITGFQNIVLFSTLSINLSITIFLHFFVLVIVYNLQVLLLYRQ